ncbi:MAG: hypothetical protein D6696_05670, partial [Acidobacteria bacterium]
MSRPTRLALIALSLFLALAPAAIQQPSLPLAPRGEEPSYLLATLSLLRDGDLVCDRGDLERLFQVFPFARNAPLELMRTTADGPLLFAVPPLYPLLALPFTAAAGSHGPLVLNALLLVLCLWLATGYLRRYNGGAVALLFGAGFVLASSAFAYAFWVHPEVLTMTLVLAALVLGWSAPAGGRERRWTASGGRLATSGLALGLATSLLPGAGLLALPLALRQRRGARLVLLLAAAVAGWALAAGWTLRLTGGEAPIARFTAAVD